MNNTKEKNKFCPFLGTQMVIEKNPLDNNIFQRLIFLQCIKDECIFYRDNRCIIYNFYISGGSDNVK